MIFYFKDLKVIKQVVFFYVLNNKIYIAYLEYIAQNYLLNIGER